MIPKNEHSLLEATHMLQISAIHPNSGEFNGHWVVKGKNEKEAVHNAHKRWVANGWQIKGVKLISDKKKNLKEEQLDEISARQAYKDINGEPHTIIKTARQQFGIKSRNIQGLTRASKKLLAKESHDDGADLKFDVPVERLVSKTKCKHCDSKFQLYSDLQTHVRSSHPKQWKELRMKLKENQEENMSNQLSEQGVEEILNTYLETMTEEERQETLKFLEEGPENEVDEFLATVISEANPIEKLGSPLSEDELTQYGQFLDAATSKNAVEASDILNNILSQKVVDRIEGIKYNVAQGLVGLDQLENG